MPKSPPETLPEGGYLAWSRDAAVGLFAVLPLWLCYEVLRLFLAPYERNGAEVFLSEVVRLLGPTGFVLLRLLFAAAVVAAASTIVRRHVPWVRVTLVTALEGTVYALILGPLAAALTASAALLQAGGVARDRLVYDLVGSLGAGIFEELVFRLVLLSLLTLLLSRAAVAFGLPKVLGLGGAIVLSGAVFSLFHHIGPGALPFERGAFLFRTCAGIVLGVLFALRGFGVCVYTHAVYDLELYLRGV